MLRPLRMALVLAPVLSACFVDRARYVAGNGDAAMDGSASDGAANDSAPDGTSDGASETGAGGDASISGVPRLMLPLSTTNVATKRFSVSATFEGSFSVEFNRSAMFDGTSGGSIPGRGGRMSADHDIPAAVSDAKGLWFMRACASPPNQTQCSPVWSFNVLSNSTSLSRNGFGVAADVLGTSDGDVLVTSRTPPMSHLSRTFFYSTLATSMTPASAGFVDECTQVLGVSAAMCSTYSQGALLGQVVAMIGDCTGDGRAEAALFGAQGVAMDVGTIAILSASSGMPSYLGRFSGTMTVPLLGMASAGDFNGDGLADLATIVQTAMSARRMDVFLAAREATPFSVARRVILPLPADGAIPTPAQIVAAGDLNDDGYADIAVRGTRVSTGAGELWIYAGSADPMSAPAEPIRIGSAMRSGFASSIAGGGDINGDGIADVFVAHGDTGSPISLAMVLGAASGPSAVSDVMLNVRNSSTTAMRAVVAAGDVNGDGLIDAVLVDDAVNAHTIEVVARVGVGAAVEPRLLGPTITPGAMDSFLPRIVARDVSGDGRADIIVAVRPGGVGDAGTIRVLSLDPMAMAPRVVATISNPDAMNIQFGIDVL